MRGWLARVGLGGPKYTDWPDPNRRYHRSMPEGDTIHRTAAVLRRALVGGTVTAARAQPRPGLVRVPRLEPLVGARVTAVEARGKHLLVGFSGGHWLRTHMRMRGSWHRYTHGEPWRLPSSRASCILETDAAVAVCFDAPEVELLTDAEVGRHRALTSLGPDLMSPAFDAGEALRDRKSTRLNSSHGYQSRMPSSA